MERAAEDNQALGLQGSWQGVMQSDFDSRPLQEFAHFQL